jgi:hypothetical protein
MEEDCGYIIIREAISLDIIQAALKNVDITTPIKRRLKYIEYSVPEQCFKIQDELTKVCPFLYTKPLSI